MFLTQTYLPEKGKLNHLIINSKKESSNSTLRIFNNPVKSKSNLKPIEDKQFALAESHLHIEDPQKMLTKMTVQPEDPSKYYQYLPIQPGISFFYSLARELEEKKDLKLQLKIPKTILALGSVTILETGNLIRQGWIFS